MRKNSLQKIGLEGSVPAKIVFRRIMTILGTALVLAFFVKLSELERFNYFVKILNVESLIEFLLFALLFFVLLITLFFTTRYARHDAMSRDRMLGIVCLSLLLTYACSWAFGELINLYISPVLLASLLVATLVDKKIGVVTQIIVSNSYFLLNMVLFKDTVVLSENVGSLLTSIIVSIFMIMLIGKSSTRLKFTVMGFVLGVGTAFIPMIIHLASGITDSYTVLMGGVWSAVAVLLSVSLYMVTLPLMENVFKVNTVFRMAELCSLESPLLKKLVKEAPGTFNHSLIVGNLAELCADAINEDTQLAKAAAYYHDMGKVKNPEYFIENQKGYNPHDDIIPEVSVSMIISHVTAGYEMLKAGGIPDVIANIALEHHGTTPVNYFLYKAQGYTEESVDKIEFSYPGPKPRTKIGAIIMIADTVEAASRAVGNYEDPEDFRKFVHSLIKGKMDTNQFSDCPITFKELSIIEDTLVEAVPSMYHTRIKYDNHKKRK
ncbi:MAG: HDIG domain-containing protein [Clostridiales bacterium]|nr:HDIG domain-containing protein [Clostridiales bacterium]